MYITKNVLKQIENTVCVMEAECGGIIAVNSDEVICDYYYDYEAGSGKASYKPTRLTVQSYIRNNWSSESLRFCGIVHSHPLCNTCEPSYVDINMAVKIMNLNRMSSFFLLIGLGKTLRLYCVTPDGECVEDELKIISDE